MKRHAIKVLSVVLLAACWACDPSDTSAQVRNAKLGPRAVQIGTIKEDKIAEASGIVVSRKYEGVYWTHNDGNDGVLYAMRRDGTLIGSIELDAKLRDWEDIATDEEGNLYISDTGNNSENRKHVLIYRVREPDPTNLNSSKRARLAVEQTWKVDFPDDPQNVESLIIVGGRGYLVFKMSEGVPADVYSFDLKDTSKKISMTKVTTLPIRQPVTAADLSSDGKQLALLTRGDLWVFDVDGDISKAPTAAVTRYPVSPVQTEGCCFDGGSVLIVAESREIFEAKLLGPAATQPTK